MGREVWCVSLKRNSDYLFRSLTIHSGPSHCFSKAWKIHINNNNNKKQLKFHSQKTSVTILRQQNLKLDISFTFKMQIKIKKILPRRCYAWNVINYDNNNKTKWCYMLVYTEHWNVQSPVVTIIIHFTLCGQWNITHNKYQNWNTTVTILGRF